MIDEVSLDRTGWARFSDDKRLRYRLARSLHPSITFGDGGCRLVGAPITLEDLHVVTFLLINPSTADAFKPDPTVQKCCKFAVRWGAHVLEVVNLFAFRSSNPKDLDTSGPHLGTDEIADFEILEACTGARRVIAGWGNGGWRAGRDNIVRDRLRRHGIQLEHLGLTGENRPLHPLARGKAFIPLDREPVVWSSP